MASGSNSTVITNPNGGKYNLLISWNENSTSVSDNTSNITVTAKLTKNNSRFQVNNAGVLRAYWHDDRTNSDTEFASLAVTELGYNSTERVASGTRNITHKDDGTLNGYAYASWTRNSTYGGYVPVSGTCSTGWTGLTTIARKATVKTVQNFNDEGNPVLGYENKAGNSAKTLQAGIFKTDGSTALVGYRDISKTGSSYTFNLTTAERNTLRAAIPNSNSMTVRFYVKTVIGSNTFYDYKEATFSITNANPTFTNFTFRDGNSATSTITGNDQYIIQNKSSLVAEISTTNKAVANKSATMSSYVFEIGSYSGTENYTTSAITKTIGAINATTNQNLKITAKDSRGNSTAVSKTVNIVPYSSPVVNASATRQNNFENNTTIKVSGSASLLKVNNVVKNAVNSTNGVQYRYKDASTSTWGSWKNIASSYNTSTGAITTTDFVLSLDNTKAWNFEFRIIDRLETKTVAISVSQGQPQFFIGSDGRSSVGGLPSVTLPSSNTGQLEVYGDVYSKGKKLMTLDMVYPVGSIFMSMNHSTPEQVSTALGGGTWEAWGAGRVPVGVGVVDDNTDNWCGNTSAGDWTAYPNLKGGEVFHTLTVNEMPIHSHTIRSGWSEGSPGSDAYRYQFWGKENLGWHGGNLGTNFTGGGARHNNLPAYITVYMWKRTA